MQPRWRLRELGLARAQLAKAIDVDADAERDKVHVSSLSLERKDSASIAHLLLNASDAPTTDLAAYQLELELDAEQQLLKAVRERYEERKAHLAWMEGVYAARRDEYAASLGTIRRGERALDDEIRDERIKFTAQHKADTKQQERDDRRYHCQHVSPWHIVVGAPTSIATADATGKPGGRDYQAEVLRMRALAVRNCEADEAKERGLYHEQADAFFAASKQSLVALLACTAATEIIQRDWIREWWATYDDFEGRREAIRHRDWAADVRRDMDHFRLVEAQRAEALRKAVPDPTALLKAQGRKLDEARQARDRAAWRRHHEARGRLVTLQQRKRLLLADREAAVAAVTAAEAVRDRGEAIRHTQRQEYIDWTLNDIAEEEVRLQAVLVAAEAVDPDV
jgi:hypothetical protein